MSTETSCHFGYFYKFQKISLKADLIHVFMIVYMYEGCPSKSCTFFITEDCVVGVIYNLYDLYICISQRSYHNFKDFAFIIQKLWQFNLRDVGV